jgi:hypothetical protein
MRSEYNPIVFAHFGFLRVRVRTKYLPGSKHWRAEIQSADHRFGFRTLFEHLASDSSSSAAGSVLVLSQEVCFTYLGADPGDRQDSHLCAGFIQQAGRHKYLVGKRRIDGGKQVQAQA